MAFSLRSFSRTTSLRTVILALSTSLLLSGCIVKTAPVDCGSYPTKEIHFWSVRDESVVFEPIIAAYQQSLGNCTRTGNINYKIVYTKLDPKEYEERILRDIATGRGPDIMALHNTWLPRYKELLTPYPGTDLNFLSDFVDVVKADGMSDGKLYALPLSVDTLGLYYNVDKFNAVNIIDPPKTWQEFDADLKLLTTYNPDGTLRRSGAAIGSVANINRGADILQAMIMQNGVTMNDEARTQATFAGSAANQATEKFLSYADASNESYTWDPNGEYSIDAFVNEHTAMMFSYSYQVATLKAKNINLNFKIAPFPQIDGASENKKVAFANYMMYGVTTQTASDPAKMRVAWDFIQTMTAAKDGTLTKMYLQATGKPTARRDLVQTQLNDPILGAFASQVLVARSWGQADQTSVDGYFAEAITAVQKGQVSVDRAIRTIQDRVTQLLQHYVKK